MRNMFVAAGWDYPPGSNEYGQSSKDDYVSEGFHLCAIHEQNEGAETVQRVRDIYSAYFPEESGNMMLVQLYLHR